VKATHHHLESLDAFRGLTIAGMILVNDPGDWDAVFPPLTHAAWNGCTLADLVFPFFILILGVAMPLAFARRLSAGAETRQLCVRIATRTVRLIGLGLLLNAAAAFPDVAALRIPGVLQRIALVYGVSAPIYLHTSTRRRIWVVALLLAAHAALLTLVPFGGGGPGLEPGHNLAGYVDRAVFGQHVLNDTFDPEGLLGTLSAIAAALVGTMAGDALRGVEAASPRVLRLAAIGTTALVPGLVWSMVLPLNKPLWTGSYALVTAGLGIIAFALCYWVIDVLRIGRWAMPFVWLGVNPLAVYFASEFVAHLLDKPWVHDASGPTTAKFVLYWNLVRPLVSGWGGEQTASLAFAVFTLAVWTLVAGTLWRRGVRVQV
jgi:predicted acyltransferase